MRLADDVFGEEFLETWAGDGGLRGGDRLGQLGALQHAVTTEHQRASEMPDAARIGRERHVGREQTPKSLHGGLRQHLLVQHVVVGAGNQDDLRGGQVVVRREEGVWGG